MRELIDLFGAIIGIFIGILLICLLVALVEYILRGMALYRMAQNAGFSSPILAWIPVASSYLLGSLCDRSVYCRSGKQWKLSVILPVIDLVGLFGGGAVATLSGLAAGYLDYGRYGAFDTDFFPGVGSLISLAALVVTVIGLYNLYWDYAQGQEVLYTVLSVIFGGLGQTIILFILRDRVPVSAQRGGWEQPYPGGYPQGPYPPPPYQGGPYPTGPQQPPYQGPYTTGPQQPPYQSGPYATGPQGGPYTTQWNQPPTQGGGYSGPTGGPGWSQTPQPGTHQPPQPPAAPDTIPQDPSPTGEGPEDK